MRKSWTESQWLIRLAPKYAGDDRRGDNKNDLHWQVKHHREGGSRNDHSSGRVRCFERGYNGHKTHFLPRRRERDRSR